MYELEGMGIRIQARRKELGLTQGEFADKLNISPQAVSKWETGLGMPDISSLPDIARVLDLSIDELFGRNVPKKREEDKETSYPEKLEKEVFITAYGDCALYADAALQIESLAPDMVRFTDGSEVDLNTRRIYNRGIHSIRLVDVDLLKNLPEEKELISSELPQDQEVKNLRLDLSSSHYDVEIRKTKGKVYWEISTEENVEIEVIGDELVLRSNQGRKSRILFNFGFNSTERVVLYLPETMQNLVYRSSGAGDLHTEVDFKDVQATILGAGDLNFQKVDKMHLDIKGAGDVNVKRVGDLHVDIAGAGDVRVGDIEGDFKARLRGAGNIDLHKGEVGNFDLTISGAGDVRASGVTAKELDVGIHGPGSLVLGRLLGSSSESVSFMGSLKILQRG